MRFYNEFKTVFRHFVIGEIEIGIRAERDVLSVKREVISGGVLNRRERERVTLRF